MISELTDADLLSRMRNFEDPDELFQQMIEVRLSKVRILSQWINREVTVEGTQQPKPIRKDNPWEFLSQEWSVGKHQALIIDVNAHWVTFGVQVSGQDAPVSRAEPTEKLMLSWDHERNRPKVLVMNA